MCRALGVAIDCDCMFGVLWFAIAVGSRCRWYVSLLVVACCALLLCCGMLVLLSVVLEFDCWCMLPDAVVGCCLLSVFWCCCVLALFVVVVRGWLLLFRAVACCVLLVGLMFCCCVMCVSLCVPLVCFYWSLLCCAMWSPLFSVS